MTTAGRLGKVSAMEEERSRVAVLVDTAGVSVTFDGRDVAAFAWIAGIDVERWAQDFAGAIRRHVDPL
jgi:hypothetical protein